MTSWCVFVYADMEACDYNCVIVYAQRLVADVKRMERRVSGKESILANSFSLLGNAYLELGDHKMAASYHMQDFRLGEELYGN